MISVMKRVARECGGMMLSAHSGTIESETKTGFRDLVTAFDKNIQNYAVQELHAAFPDAQFICEEGDSAHSESDGFTFVIDPIDGTANFTHHYGHSCISIACIRNGVPEAAVIYNAFRDELFSAEKGRGACLNGESIHVFDGSLAESLVIFGTAPYNLSLTDETLARVRSIYGRCQDVRRTGSAALDLCYIAAGRAGLYFEMELSLWDYAAGALIAEEAGAICREINGERLTFGSPHKSTIIAGTERTIRESGLIDFVSAGKADPPSASRADRAEELFRQGYNCSQSVFAAFADVAGLSVSEAAKYASPFGAGFGKLREVCGAVSGMTMLAGILKGYSDPADHDGKKELYALIQKMCAEFEEKEGSVVCRDLLGLKKGEDLAEPAVRTEEYYRSRPCVGACRTAAEIAEKYLIDCSE